MVDFNKYILNTVDSYDFYNDPRLFPGAMCTEKIKSFYVIVSFFPFIPLVGCCFENET